MEELIRMVVADDHDAFRETLVHLLSREPDIEVVGEAANGREAFQRCVELEPDVILLDLIMPHGDAIDTAEPLRHSVPGVRIIMISVFDSDHQTARELVNTADRYLAKGFSRSEILAAIRAVAAERHSGRSTETNISDKRGRG